MKRPLLATTALSMMAALALLTTTAQAAQIWVNPAKDHGHVIHIKGDIEKGDANQFANVVGNAGVKPNDATVYLDSPGGYVLEGVPIGRAIKKYGWNTYVEKDTTCASMCAVIWLAGHTRFINEDGRVGFHSAIDPKRGHGKRSDLGNAIMFGFYHELGVSDKAARVFLAAEPGDDAIWLTDTLAKSLDIAAVTIPAEEKPKVQDKTALDKAASDPIATKLADASPTPQLPARDAGDAGPPSVKPADLVPVKPSDLAATPEQPRHEQSQRRERPRRRYAGGGYGGRVCGFTMPVPYIGGVTIRGRC
jgi:membrane-bound ClpP family serine protease